MYDGKGPKIKGPPLRRSDIADKRPLLGCLAGCIRRARHRWELSVLTVRHYNPRIRNPGPLRIACIAVFLVLLCATRTHAQSSPTSQDSTTNAPSATDKPAPVAPAHGTLPSCTYMPNSAYTKEAKAAKIQGSVLIEGVVGLDGRITSLRVLKAMGYGLDESALKTLKKWKCNPAIGPNGKPVPVIVPFQINFRLR
jgi:TonB family protein